MNSATNQISTASSECENAGDLNTDVDFNTNSDLVVPGDETIDGRQLANVHSAENNRSPSSTAAVMTAFMDMLQQFLQALEDVFPECPKVRQYQIALKMRLFMCGENEASRAGVLKQAIESYHQSMQPFYARCIEHDATLLSENIDIMHNIDMALKWTDDLHEETKLAIWEYITKLNEFANIYAMYAKIPTGMLSSIETIAQTFATQIGNGTMGFGDLNLQTMTEQVMGALNTTDLQEFAHRMQSGDGESMMSNVTTMYSMMSSLMKNQPM
jgi:hypothetical protein